MEIYQYQFFLSWIWSCLVGLIIISKTTFDVDGENESVDIVVKSTGVEDLTTVSLTIDEFCSIDKETKSIKGKLKRRLSYIES